MRARNAAAVFCVAIFCLPSPAAAEHPVTRLFTTEDGLVRNWVVRVRKDSHGRLWFCTVEGLSLFDGERFANYGTAQGLPNRFVSDILEAGDGSYWLATYSGLYRFRPRAVRAASFEKVQLLGGAPDPSASVLFRTRAGELWCGTNAGLYRIHGGERSVGEIVPLTAMTNHFPDIDALEEDDGRSLWIGMATVPGLIRLHPDGSSSFVHFSAPGAPKGVETLLADREGFLWAKK